MLLLMAGIEPNPGPPKKDLQAQSDEDSANNTLEAHFERFRATNRSRRLQENMRPQCSVTRNSKEVSTNEVEAQQTKPIIAVKPKFLRTMDDAKTSKKVLETPDNSLESGSSCIEMEPQTQASPLDQHTTQVPVPIVPARGAADRIER
ncbi:uncharacterized protein LOC128232756 [Mya arenaria]|uniref:uncharacterized protein LOC128232756 n=1 Tax=Mya arenaria TaxID=6604 RepID=UPI0022DF8D26|nr:uncharacterized protein LOC128232756 [Mya arenaria]